MARVAPRSGCSSRPGRSECTECTGRAGRLAIPWLLVAALLAAACGQETGGRAEPGSAERIAELERRVARLESRLSEIPADEESLRDADVTELVDRLAAEDPVARLRAGAELGRRGPDARAEALELLEGAAVDARQRRAAAWMLALSAEQGDAEAVLSARETTDDATDRALLAIALGRTGESAAVDPLIDDLEHASRRVRAAAALALAELPAAQATLPLLEAAGVEEDLVASLAREAIRAQGQAALLFLTDRWEPLDPRRRERAVRIVAEIEGDATTRFLEQRLDDADARVALTAALALARRGSTSGREVAIAHLGSEDPVLARRAREVLDAFEDRSR